MERFIKKNLFLVGVLGLSALGVLVLLVLSVTQYIEMSKYISKTEDMRKQNENLMRQKPPAVQENIELVQKDIDGFTAKTNEFKAYFGHPLYPALKAFAAELGVTVPQLQEKFRAFWDEEKQTQGPREQTYRRFRAIRGVIREGEKELWDMETWDSAMEVFVKAAQKTTMEEIDERNQEEIFLSSLGLPRNMGKSELRLDAFAKNMQNKVVDLLTDKHDISMMGVYFSQKDTALVKSNKDFVDGSDSRSGKDKMQMPGPSAMSSSSSRSGLPGLDGNRDDEVEIQPADVIRNWEIISDLAVRICNAKLKSVEDISYSNLVGREDGGCHFYTYTLSVMGSEVAIREFLNQLNMAYKDNRVYVVRNLSISKQEDQVQDIIDVEQGILGNHGEETATLAARGDNMNMGMNMPVPANVALGARSMQKETSIHSSYFNEEEEMKKSGNKAVCVAGRSNSCQATMTIDYVVYSADNLK